MGQLVSWVVAYPPTDLPTYLPTYVLADLLTYVRTSSLTHLLTRLPTYLLPAYLLGQAGQQPSSSLSRSKKLPRFLGRAPAAQLSYEAAAQELRRAT